MPLSTQAQAFLNKLKTSGLDTSSIEQQLTTTPTLQTTLPSILETPYAQQLQSHVQGVNDAFINKLSDYVTYRDTIRNLPEGDMRTAMETAMGSLETEFQSLGVNLDDVSKLTLQGIQDMRAAAATPAQVPSTTTQATQGDNMTEEERKKLEERVEVVGSNVLYANANINNEIQAKRDEFFDLMGRRPTAEENKKIADATNTAITTGNRNVAAVIDEALGLQAIRDQKAKDAHAAELAAAKAEGERIGRQQALTGQQPREEQSHISHLTTPQKQEESKVEGYFQPLKPIGRDARRSAALEHYYSNAGGGSDNFVGR